MIVAPPAAIGPVAETPASKYFAPVPVKVMGPETGARKTAAELVDTRISAPETPVTTEWKVAVAPPVMMIFAAAPLLTAPKRSVKPADNAICLEFVRPALA